MEELLLLSDRGRQPTLKHIKSTETAGMMGVEEDGDRREKKERQTVVQPNTSLTNYICLQVILKTCPTSSVSHERESENLKGTTGDLQMVVEVYLQQYNSFLVLSINNQL